MRALTLLVPLLLLASDPTNGWSEEPKEPGPAVTDAQRDTAINRGRRYLQRNVFKLPDASGTPQKQFTVAVAGLVHLLSEGKGMRTDGKADEIRQTRAFLARYLSDVEKRTADASQLPDAAGMFRSDRVIQYTWPVALAGLFFAEAHARGKGGTEAQRAIKQARILLRRAQLADGGWGHHRTKSPGAVAKAPPRPKIPGFPDLKGLKDFKGLGGGYPATLLSSSFVVASALGLIEGRGPRETHAHHQRAVTYFRKAQLSNGNFPYDPSQRSAHLSKSGVSRAAGSAFALWTLGVPYKDKAVALSLGFVDDNFDYLNEGHGSSTLNLLYGALLQKTRGSRAWKRFKARYFRPILDEQAEDGACQCICEGKAFASTNDSDRLAPKKLPPGAVVKRVRKTSGDPGLLKTMMKGGTDAYVTSLHTLILLLDRTNLELIDRKGPAAPGKAPGAVTPR